MKTLKQAFIFGIIFLPIFASAQSSREIVSLYEATWDGPFFTILFGKAAGYLPKRFSLRETVWKDSTEKEEFSIGLDDKHKKAWVRIYSDTTRESALWLPRDPKRVLNADVIRFVGMLQDLFADSSRCAMRGTFSFGKGKLHAQAEEYAPTSQEMQKFGLARAFTVLTFDTTGTANISGRVVVTLEDSMLCYRKIAVHLPDDDITVSLEEIRNKK